MATLIKSDISMLAMVNEENARLKKENEEMRQLLKNMARRFAKFMRSLKEMDGEV